MLAIEKASVSNVPSISTLPLISKVAASNSPEIVRFLIPVESILASVVITFDAIAVPAVNPSSNSNSASAKTALPAVKPTPETTPLALIIFANSAALVIYQDTPVAVIGVCDIDI